MGGRWGIAVAAVLVQLALGAVYAWSVFNKPLQAEFGWSKSEAVLPFEAAIGTMPATAADFFGTPNAGAIYGAMIVAWSIGGVVGPLVSAKLYESSGTYDLAFTVLGIVALVSLLLPLITRPPAEGGPGLINLQEAEADVRVRRA
jgi:OFA family oxalate/formate antiporter-like MFS transporter